MSIWAQKSVSIQKRTSPLKFDDSAEQAAKSSVSNLSTKVETSMDVLYPADYGESCKVHAEPAYEVCSIMPIYKRPSWCLATWCYVDPCYCEAKDVAI